MKKRNIFKYGLIILIILGSISGLFFLYKDLEPAILMAINSKNLEPITDKFIEYDILAPIIIGLLQAIFILITFLPVAPLQIVTGVVLNPYIAFATLLAGVFLGNMIMFFLVKRYGPKLANYYNTKKNKNIDLEENILSKKIILLYFLPVIPYGLIAYTCANSKIKFWKYMFITTIGTIPSIIISISLGSLVINSNYLLVGIFIAVLIALTILTAIFPKKIQKLFKKKQKKDITFYQNNIKKPNRFLYWFFKNFLKAKFFKKVNLQIHLPDEVKDLQGPYILIYNHPSVYDWMYSFIPLYPNKISAIMAYYYFCDKRLAKVLHQMGCFPKFLYQPDISAIKNIKKVIKWGGILGIAPEGRLSAYGELETIAPATEKLLKHLGVPIVVAKISGGYFTKPKWATNLRKGRVDLEYEYVLSSEDIAKMTTEEIEKTLYDKLYYNDFAWQEKNKVYFEGEKFAEGLEHILYVCPVCNSEFTTYTFGNHIKCNCCNNDVILNNYYEFESNNQKTPKNIRDWYLFQKEYERKNVENINYKLESNVTLKLPSKKGKKFEVAGLGIAKLTHEGVTYTGTIYGEQVKKLFKIQNIPAIPFGVNEDFEIYHDNTLYYFIPENIRECVKWSVVGEEIYLKHLKDKNNE